jgi:epoxyqueuosine reductase
MNISNTNYEPGMTELNEELTIFIKANGGSLAGFADLGEIEAEARDSFPYGISIGVALDPKVMSEVKIGPTPEYYTEYKKVNLLLDDLGQKTALLLVKKGYKAKLRPATFEEDKAHLTAKLPHKTVATRAGLGWIGKNNLLVTREYGPAARLVTVLTDAPVTPGKAMNESLCSRCNHCVDACPAHALTGEKWQPGVPREILYNAFACRDMERNLSQKLIGESLSICGLCITSCPWTQRYLKNNQ